MKAASLAASRKQAAPENASHEEFHRAGKDEKQAWRCPDQAYSKFALPALIPLSLSNKPNFDAGNSYWNFSSHRYVKRGVTICFY